MSRKKGKQSFHCFTFSPEMIQVAQEALKLLAQSLARAEGQSEKVRFARETMQQVKNKLDAMRASVGTLRLTSFDWNEKLVIAAAIQLYMAESRTVSASSPREQEMRRCQKIMRFALDPGINP